MDSESGNSAENFPQAYSWVDVISDADVCVYLLQATTKLANALLSDEYLDRGVNRALEILGMSAEADRLTVLQHQEDPRVHTLGYVIVQYEWLSAGTSSQIEHPELRSIPYNGLENCHNLLVAGKYWGGLLDEMSESFRRGQLKLGVKATYAIPIMVKERYWGAIGLDFCRTARLLKEAEIEVLKIAASCIGSAIERDLILIEQAKIECEAEIVKQKSIVRQERDRSLKLTTNVARALLNDRDLNRAIATALQIVGEGIDTDRVVVMEHHRDRRRESLGYAKVLFEWHSVNAVSQLAHRELQQISYEGVEDWYERLVKGETVGAIIRNLPEPLRQKQIAIGVKATYAVPIAINEQYWGVLAFDNCREAKQYSETEISILKTTAACIGSAIQQDRIRREREQTERHILLEQQRVSQLEKYNRELKQRDRIFAATASAANAILTEENFDKAIDKALRIIAESIDTDRIAVMEHFADSTSNSQGDLQVIYEWHSVNTIAQLNHPLVGRVNYEGIEDWYELMCRGNWTGGTIDRLPEPFRSKMAIIDVKSTYAIPIMVEGQYWGIVGIDNCRQPTQFKETEIAIFKTAAACIGGAIAKERSNRAYQKAEKAILKEKATELTKVNAVLNQSLINLADSTDLDSFLSQVMQEISRQTNAATGHIFLYDAESKTLAKRLSIRDGKIERGIAEYDCPLFRTPFSVEGIPGFQFLCQTRAIDLLSLAAENSNSFWCPVTVEWYGGMGYQEAIAIALTIGDKPLGLLCLGFAEKIVLQPKESNLICAFANQAAIAIQLTKLAEQTKNSALTDERNRMAREIHDTLAQAFTGISLQLEAARNAIFIQPEAALERLLRAKNLAKEGIVEARRSVRALRPEVLEFSDLSTALHQLVDKMIVGTGIKTQVLIEGEIRTLNSETEVNLFRIAQEAIVNILRHAEASIVTIGLIYEPNSVYLQIKDNGVGFDPRLSLDKSFGLIGMEERSDRIKGNLIINSAIAKGTEITVTITE